MANVLSSLIAIVLPKRRGNEKGTGLTNTYNPQNSAQVLSAPTYREHMTDIFTSRASTDSRALIRDLFKHDSDVSATVNAYLTVANTEPLICVYDQDGVLDRDGLKTVHAIIEALTVRSDYSTGFELRPSLRVIAENMRYLALLRGGIAAETVFDKTLILREIRHIDLATIEWYEDSPGRYRPVQRPANSNDPIDLNTPNFHVSFFRRDPTSIYPHSFFVAAVNTIAARQQVINDLYRIMQKTGYPRISIEVAEEVLRKNAPPTIAANEKLMKSWLADRLNEINGQVTTLRADQAFVHMDSIKPGVMNKEGPAKAFDVTNIIAVLNAQNQAALKVMATVIGRGETGVNTASVEARIFSLNAQELNEPVAEVLSQMLTMALRLTGSTSRVVVRFDNVELRPTLELEPQQVMRQARFLELLSQGLISDDEFHIEIFNRPRPDDIPEVSGTQFMSKGVAVDETKVSPNGDPLGRGLAPEGSKSANSKTVKK